MRQSVIISMAATLLVMCFSAAAAQKVDFSGTWALDKSRSEGLPPGMDQTMTVKQTGDRLDIEGKVSGLQGEQSIKDEFILDGKQTEVTEPIRVGTQETKARRTSKWSADGKGFDVLEEAPIQGEDGPATLKVTRHWQLSDDGKTLTVDMTLDGPRGVRKTKRVFSKK
jgi:hypothetical protein